MKRIPAACAWIAAVLHMGCAGSRVPAVVVEPRPLGRDVASASTPSPSGDPTFEEPAGTLTLHDALAAALVHNPRLASFAWSVRVAEAEAQQADLRPNPALAGEVENFAGSGDFSSFDAAEGTVLLSQVFELGGKRGKRNALAASQHTLAAWDHESVRLDILTATTRSFIDVLSTQEQLRLADELVGVAEAMLADVARRVEAGSVSPVEQSRARVELETSRLDRNRMQRELVIRRRQLAAHWGSDTPAFARAQGDLETTKAIPPLEAILPLVADTPELARWNAERDNRRASVAAAQAAGIPNLEIVAGLRYLNDPQNDAHAWIVGFGLPLPLFDRNQGAARAARYRLQRGDAEQRDAAIRASSALATTHEELLARDDEVQALRQRVLPEAERTFRTAQEAWRRGALRLSDVLDTERNLFELRARYVETLAAHHRAVAELERLIGRRLDTVPNASEAP